MQTHEKTTPHEVPAKPWEDVGTDIFMVNENMLCIVHGTSKFLVVKKVESMLTEVLTIATNVVFAEFG